MAITNAFSPTADTSQPSALFGRSYSLAIGAPGQTAALQFSNFSVPDEGGILVTPSAIRLKFDISKNPIGTPNNSKFEIFNLSQASRQAIKKGYILELKAGYKGLVETIFTGNVRPDGIKSQRHGADISTNLECGDGESAIVLAKLDKSYPPGTSLIQILEDIAEQLGIEDPAQPDGVTAGTVLGIPPVIYGRGISIHGPCNVSLNKLLKPQGLHWSVQNGKLEIIPVGANKGASAILVSAETGMLGVPSFNGQYVEFQSLLNPKLVPNALVKVVSENNDPQINGFFKIQTSHFEGDTHDNHWGVKCQGIPQPNIQQKFTLNDGLNFSTSTA
jgi:hypothetical protein